MNDIFAQAREAEKAAIFDSFAGVQPVLESTETVATYQLAQPVTFTLNTVRYQTSLVRVRNSLYTDVSREGQEAFTDVEAYSRALTAKGTVSQRDVPVWRTLPTPLASLFPVVR